jgi:endonuclease/exonuclease/phosphatase family metal-dependent hydrolase
MRRRRTAANDPTVAIGAVVGELSRTRQGRRLLAVLAAVVVVALVAWQVRLFWQNHLRPRHPVGPAVRVATWNLRQFSERRNVDVRAIAEVIRASHFDVVAVQEVKRNGEQVDALLNELGTPWRATSMSATTGNYERFVFLYEGDHVQEIGRARFVNSPQAAVFARLPYQASFRAGAFDFTLVTVHLSFDDRARRRREVDALVQVAQDVAAASSEKDVIVLGDFNAENPQALRPFADAGWASLNHDPTNRGSSEVYDTLIIDPAPTREWNGAAGAVSFDDILPQNQNDRTAREHVSDHRPAWADFVTNLPDDD